MSEPSDRDIEELANAFYGSDQKQAGIDMPDQDDDEDDFLTPPPAPVQAK